MRVANKLTPEIKCKMAEKMPEIKSKQLKLSLGIDQSNIKSRTL